MKTLFFLIVLAAVVSVVIWRSRKADAEADLARSKKAEHRYKQRKAAITPEEHVEWPKIVVPVTGSAQAGEEPEFHEPSMTTIEFKPTEHASL
jgi:hypothetical protein